MRERLLTSPLEEQQKKAYLANVIKREKKTNATREKLELKYRAAVKAKDDEVGIGRSLFMSAVFDLSNIINYQKFKDGASFCYCAYV